MDYISKAQIIPTAANIILIKSVLFLHVGLLRCWEILSYWHRTSCSNLTRNEYKLHCELISFMFRSLQLPSDTCYLCMNLYKWCEELHVYQASSLQGQTLEAHSCLLTSTFIAIEKTSILGRFWSNGSSGDPFYQVNPSWWSTAPYILPTFQGEVSNVASIMAVALYLCRSMTCLWLRSSPWFAGDGSVQLRIFKSLTIHP